MCLVDNDAWSVEINIGDTFGYGVADCIGIDDKERLNELLQIQCEQGYKGIIEWEMNHSKMNPIGPVLKMYNIEPLPNEPIIK